MSVMWHGNLIFFVAPEIKIIISQNKYSWKIENQK